MGRTEENKEGWKEGVRGIEGGGVRERGDKVGEGREGEERK